jgi:hypothetical protein
MLPMILLCLAHAADSPRYSKKCASLVSQPRAPRSWPEVATVSTTHTRNAIPHQLDAIYRLCATRRRGRRSTDTFQTQAASSPSSTWAASVQQYGCALQDGCRWNETTTRDHANKRIMNMRAIRGQRRRQWLCFCRRQKTSNTVSRPWLPIILLGQAVAAPLLLLLKKRASFSSRSSGPSPRPEIGAISNYGYVTRKAASSRRSDRRRRARIALPLFDGHFSNSSGMLQNGAWAASVRCTIVHCAMVSVLRDDSARGPGRVNTENTRDSLSKAAVVMLLRMSRDARHCVTTAVVNAVAQLGSVGVLWPLFKNRASFTSQLRELSLVSASSYQSVHDTCRRCKAAQSRRSTKYACARMLHGRQSTDTSETQTTSSRSCRRRLRCNIRLCAARRVSVRRDVFARRCEQANTKNASYSWPTRPVVVFLWASGGIRHCGVANVANGVAQSGRRGFVPVMVQKTREFLESVKCSLVWARDCRGQHAACMSQEAATSCRSSCRGCARIELQLFDGHFSNSNKVVVRQQEDGFTAPYLCAS